jgi:hypothetical protein
MRSKTKLKLTWQFVRRRSVDELLPMRCLGPPGALYGNDGHFLSAPVLRSGDGAAEVLGGPLSWRSDSEGFRPEVRALAEEFGYE